MGSVSQYASDPVEFNRGTLPLPLVEVKFVLLGRGTLLAPRQVLEAGRAAVLAWPLAMALWTLIVTIVSFVLVRSPFIPSKIFEA